LLTTDDTQPNTNAAADADAAAADTAPLREINSEDDVAGAEGGAVENIEAQPGFAPDAPGDSGIGAPSRGGADAAGLEEHSGDSNNEELAVDPKGYVGRPIVVSWDLYGDSPGVIDKWAHRGAHGGYKHHVTYNDPDGKWPNYSDTYRWHDLGDHGIKWGFEDETPLAAPFTGGQRPMRERREPDRFSLATLIAAYTEASGAAGFTASLHRASPPPPCTSTSTANPTALPSEQGARPTST